MRLLAILLLLLLPFGMARAQSDIHRCVGASGGVIFTDRACSDLNASPAVPAPTVSASASDAPTSIAQPPPVLCASDMTQLKQAVVDAFADRNPNRLAGLMLWEGSGREAVVANIREFTRMMAHPLVGVRASEYTSTAPPSSSTSTGTDPSVLSMSATPSPSPPQGDSLSVETESDDGSGATQETHFGVVRHDGCLWLEPPY
ncbi:DUF4124 domain-containing protein [Dyella dinghuensis]|uniref:DUF4124 domain-containing protein n=1 Tax=Dyella dinghuensis TaxID=1920169 RepID=A0A432LPX8_9GAMM|nr:DUF4124 domain-containing protein [Dyella dinghuensis]RUL62083.1 DUF4124 domain-containing protein [Dyella dinghuensis]